MNQQPLNSTNDEKKALTIRLMEDSCSISTQKLLGPETSDSDDLPLVIIEKGKNITEKELASLVVTRQGNIYSKKALKTWFASRKNTDPNTNQPLTCADIKTLCEKNIDFEYLNKALSLPKYEPEVLLCNDDEQERDLLLFHEMLELTKNSSLSSTRALFFNSIQYGGILERDNLPSMKMLILGEPCLLKQTVLDILNALPNTEQRFDNHFTTILGRDDLHCRVSAWHLSSQKQSTKPLLIAETYYRLTNIIILVFQPNGDGELYLQSLAKKCVGNYHVVAITDKNDPKHPVVETIQKYFKCNISVQLIEKQDVVQTLSSRLDDITYQMFFKRLSYQI